VKKPPDMLNTPQGRVYAYTFSEKCLKERLAFVIALLSQFMHSMQLLICRAIFFWPDQLSWSVWRSHGVGGSIFGCTH